LTFSARTEDEVDLEELKDKVSKASATSYNFKERPTAAIMDEQPGKSLLRRAKSESQIPFWLFASGPVGSNHQRIIPQKELPKLSERERFWNEEQSKEKVSKMARSVSSLVNSRYFQARIDAERTRKVSEAQKLEEERLRREEEDAKRRDKEVSKTRL